MDYLKIKLKSGKMAYALREYFPYTDKPFFKSLDDILIDESLQVSLAHLFVQLYRDELVFLYENITEHKYIVPIIHESKKFSEINNIICRNVAKIMGVEVLNDYFDIIKIPRVDIRDDYTKDEHNIEIAIRKKYIDIPVIIFDCCCSTGIIFNKLSTEKNNNNLYITYGIRFNSNNIENTYVTDINNNEFDDDNFDTKKPGYFVRIYGLFGEKDVEVDFRDSLSILIGENGFGKSTATRLAFLALKAYCEIESKKNYDNINWNDLYSQNFLDNNNKNDKHNVNDILSILAPFNFKKIEIYYSDYFYEIEELDDIKNNKITPQLHERVYSKFFGKGTIVNIVDNVCEIIFDEIPEQIKKIASYALERLDENGNIIATKSKHKVSFIDKNGELFHEQYILNDKYLDLEFFKNHNILIDENNIEIMGNKKICKRDIFGAWNIAVDNLTIKVNDFCFNYDFVKKFGIFSNSCVYTIDYSDTIPSTEYFSYNNREAKYFFNIITLSEYQNIIRKIILKDRTIEIDYKKMEIKYKLKTNFNNITNLIYNKISNNKYDKVVYFDEIDEQLFNQFISDPIILFDCTKSRQLKAIPPRDRITLDYFNEKYSDNYDGDYDEFSDNYDEDEDYDEFSGNYDDDEDFNAYEDDFEIPEYYDYSWDRFIERSNRNDGENLSEEDLRNMYNQDCNEKFIKMYSDLFVENIDLIDYENKFFNERLIDVHSLLHNKFLDSVKTTLYSAVKTIFFYNDFENNTKEVDEFINYFLSNEVKDNIFKLYKEVFEKNFDVFSLGIYDILNENDFKKLSTIVNNLYSNGINSDNDYFVVLGLNKLIEIYNADFINAKHILLEKLLNKYLINKTTKVYANSLVVRDLKDNFIPLNCLSTGERNLIILFILALSNTNSLIVLDEPDLSMSVEWQSKILVDLLNYTNNRYMIVTQSPLLIQKNNLSTYVKRMEFYDEVTLIPLIKMIKSISKSHKNRKIAISDIDIDLSEED